MKRAVCMGMVLAAALGAAVAKGGDSAAFLLDTRSGTRAARAVERIAYSTAWNGGTSVRVAVDGATLFEAAAPASGVVLWNASAAGSGVHTLTHESGGVTLTALFTQPENIYRVRLHGNGATTEAGEEWVDLGVEFGESVVFPKGLFTRGKRLSGDVSGWFKGWWPGRAEFDGAEDMEKDLWDEGIRFQEKDIEEWKRLGWAEDIDGVPTVHFYAVWKSEVLVGVHGADGKELAPAELESVVKYCLRHDGEWRTGVGSYEGLPGEQVLLVELDSGYGGQYGVTVLKKEGMGDLEELAPVSDGGWVYDIPSTEGPQKVCLQVRVEPKEEMGSIAFNCASEMTDAQRIAWGEKFPPFDEGKAQFRVWPAGVSSGDGMPVGRSVELPAGTYRAEVEYAENAGSKGWTYWAGGLPDEIEVKSGRNTEVNVVFLPFGSAEVNYCWTEFDGNGGRVAGETLLWFGPWGSPTFSGAFPPKPTRAGGWLFSGWFTPGKKKIEDWWELENYLRHDTLANLTLTADWTNVTDAATGSGVPVSYAWLEENAGEALLANGGDYEAAAMATAANGQAVWKCYVVGCDPNDPNVALRVELSEEDGRKKVGPVGGKKEGRTYTVEGKKVMTDEEWEDVTDVEDLEGEGWRFFRVGVELAE